MSLSHFHTKPTHPCVTKTAFFSKSALSATAEARTTGARKKKSGTAPGTSDPGAKVYCAFVYGGLGHEAIRVFGKSRRTRRIIDIVMEARYIKNIRRQKVYDKKVLAFPEKYPCPVAASQLAEWMLEDLNNRSCEIKGGLERPS